MPGDWYYQIMGEVIGPLTADELRIHALKRRCIYPDTLVRKGVEGQWVSADRVRGLHYTEQPPPPLPDSPQPAQSTPALQPSKLSEEEPRLEKACPFCGEPILVIAKKCKHCGEFLDDSLKKPGKAIFKASSKFIGLLCSYHIMDANNSLLAKLKPSESFEMAIPKTTVMYVKYTEFGRPIKVQCHANEINRFSITLSQSRLYCVVSRVDVIDSDP